ncbi:hypothetical protein FQZ97_492590 [compost metagenome]
MSQKSNDGAWGFIEKRRRFPEVKYWSGVEPCYSEEQGQMRVAYLEEADPDYEYRIVGFLELPIWVSKRLD